MRLVTSNKVENSLAVLNSSSRVALKGLARFILLLLKLRSLISKLRTLLSQLRLDSLRALGVTILNRNREVILLD